MSAFASGYVSSDPQVSFNIVRAAAKKGIHRGQKGLKQPTPRGRIWETAPDASASPPSKWDNSQGPPRKPAAKSLRRTWAGAPLSKKMPRMGEANCSIPVFSSEPRRGKRGNPLKHGIGCSCVPVQNLLSSNIQKNTPPLTCIPLGNWEVQYSKVATKQCQ